MEARGQDFVAERMPKFGAHSMPCQPGRELGGIDEHVVVHLVIATPKLRTGANEGRHFSPKRSRIGNGSARDKHPILAEPHLRWFVATRFAVSDVAYVEREDPLGTKGPSERSE